MPEKPKTVRVRAAAFIDDRGNFAVSGCNRYVDSGNRRNAFYALKDAFPEIEVTPRSLHWIEADIPIPQSETIEAEVVEQC